MTDGVGPTNQYTDDSKYHAQFKDTPAFHKMWESLFHKNLTNKESAEMTDGFMKMINNFMNNLSQEAIKELKKQKRMIQSDYRDTGD